jgi:hypothetical protein
LKKSVDTGKKITAIDMPHLHLFVFKEYLSIQHIPIRKKIALSAENAPFLHTPGSTSSRTNNAFGATCLVPLPLKMAAPCFTFPDFIATLINHHLTGCIPSSRKVLRHNSPAVLRCLL